MRRQLFRDQFYEWRNFHFPKIDFRLISFFAFVRGIFEYHCMMNRKKVIMKSSDK